MSNLEHLIENGLITMTRCNGYDDWHSHIADDPNWDGVLVNIEDLWTICQYVIYTWCQMRCEECKGSDCIECKYRNSDVCNDCKRQWVHKDDKFELNLYTDTFGTADEIVDYVADTIDNSLRQDEWLALWRYTERIKI